MAKVYYQKPGEKSWQLAHVFKKGIKGNIQASQATKRIASRGYKVKVEK